MTNFQVTTQRNHVKNSKGHWSKKSILCNPSSKHSILLANYSTDDCYKLLTQGQREIARKYLPKYFLQWIEKPNYLGPLTIEKLLNPNTPNWEKLTTELIQEPQTTAEKITGNWLHSYEESFDQTVINKESHRLPSSLSMLLIDWNNTQCSDTRTLIKNLLLLSQIDTSTNRFLNSSTLNTDLARHFLQNLPANERSLLIWLRPSIFQIVHPLHCLKAMKLLVNAALEALICLRANNIVLLPIKLKYLKNCIGRHDLLSETNVSNPLLKKAKKAGLYELIVSSNINSLEDIPIDLFKIYKPSHFKAGFNKIFQKLMKLESLNEEENVFPIDQLTNREHDFDKQKDKWSLAWARETLPADWVEFIEVWWITHEASRSQRISSLRPLLEWACQIRKFESPWDICSLDLRNIFKPKLTNTFAHYIKSKTYENKHGAWNAAQNTFGSVCQNGIHQDSPIVDRDAIHNPFKGLENPFKIVKKNFNKTTRIRIPDHVLDALISKLLDLDEEGTPTFNWARSACNDMVSVSDPDNDKQTIQVWCPSRAISLALMMVQPLRYAQIRWLDQGLMDEEIYDTLTGTMRPNDHPLSDFRYDNGLTHEKQYGRPTGVLQEFHDLFSNRKERCIFINTNKTQIWTKVRKSGYEIPWPDGKELLEATDKQTIERGEWLNRVYKILEIQIKWMEKYDPNPHPISFYHVLEDKNRTNHIDDIRNNWPWFIPLFRDLDITKTITVAVQGKNVYASPPVSRSKMTSLFIKLLQAVEKDYQESGIDIQLTETQNNGKITGKFAPHTFRVAMISQLCEMGVPIEVIAEFFSGHASHIMAAYYVKALPFAKREQLMEAVQNHNFSHGIGDIQQSLKNGKTVHELLTQSSRYQSHCEEMPDTYAAFTPVEGGVCPKGGRGKGCLEGGLHEKTDNENSTNVTIGPVLGGCANCRFFLTGPDFVQEQGLVANNIIFKIHAFMDEISQLHNQMIEVKTKLAQTPQHEKQKQKLLNFQIQDIQSTKADREEKVMPLFVEWINWLELIQKSKELKQEQSKELILIGQTEITENFFELHQRKSNMFGLVRTIIEQHRFIQRPGILFPKEPAACLCEFMDIILNEINPGNLLIQITDKNQRITAASLLAGRAEEEFGDPKIQEYLDKRLPLDSTIIENGAFLNFANKTIEQAKRGELQTLTHINH